MKRFLSLALICSMLFCSCANSGGKTNQNDSSTIDTNMDITSHGTTTPPTTDQAGYTPDPSNPLAELFFEPTAEYRWHSLQHGIANSYKNSVNAVNNYVLKMRNEGEGGVVMNVPFENGFVDNLDHFKNLNGVADILIDNGLSFWLYDEQGYPSGSAGGRVVIDNPEYIAQGLTLIKKTGSGKNPITVNKNERLIRLYTAYAIDEQGNVHDVTINDNAVSFAGVSGSWTLYVYALKEFYEGTHAETKLYDHGWLTESYTNIMDKNAVAKFIEVAYKPYVEKFNYLDKAVAVFTDEPSLIENHDGSSNPYAQLSWAPGFEELFEEMHGYSITHKLHYMFENYSDEARIVRTNYRQTVAKMVSENFFGQINDFCVENGTLLGGHLFMEEAINSTPFYGDIMLCYRQMGLLGVDILLGDPSSFYGSRSSQAMSIKNAASISRITDKENLTMIELCILDLIGPSALNEEQQEILWNAMNLIYFFGGNFINSYVNIDATKSNKQHFVDYFARLGYISQSAEWDGDIALYNPIATHQSYTMASGADNLYEQKDLTLGNDIAHKLWDSQLDFLRIDDTFIHEAEIKNGALTNGYASFTQIIIPHAEVMSLKSLQKLYEFQQAGGKVYFANGVPYLADRFEDMDALKELASQFTPTLCDSSISVDEMISEIKKYDNFNLTVKTKRSSSAVCLSKYTLNGEETYWIYNESMIDNKFKLVYDGEIKGFEIYDPLTGEIEYVEYTEGSEFEIDFNKRCAKFVVIKK